MPGITGIQIGSQYVAETLIGRGAFGEVWRGSGPSGPVAIKLLKRELTEDQDLVSRFMQEYRLLARVRHPAVVQVHSLVADAGQIALVMDFVSGGDLGSYLADHREHLSPAVALHLAAEVAEALSAVHAAGVVHRDLKPGNILLIPDHERKSLSPVLADFGIARLLQSPRLTRTSMVIGTPQYMAPEVAGGYGEPSPATDIYATGILLYRLLAGHVPFDHSQPHVLLRMHCEQAPAKPGDVSPELWSLISACLAKEPAHRPDAAGLANWLRNVPEAGQPIPLPMLPRDAERSVHSRLGSVGGVEATPAAASRRSSDEGAVRRYPRWSTRRSLLLALALALVAGGGVLTLNQWHSPGHPASAAAPSTNATPDDVPLPGAPVGPSGMVLPGTPLPNASPPTVPGGPSPLARTVGPSSPGSSSSPGAVPPAIPLVLDGVSDQMNLVGSTASYSGMSVASGTSPFTWSAVGLPPGLAISSGNGAIAGSPTTAGVYTITVHVFDKSVPQRDVTRSFTWTVNPANCWLNLTDNRDLQILDLAIVSREESNSCFGTASANSRVTVDIVHQRIGDLVVTLYAPDGASFVLHNRQGGTTQNLHQTYALDLSAHARKGVWSLAVQDAASGVTGYLNTLTLQL